ncbi:MAG: type II toxin-antitoxin system RelE/ParE family toxin [bacterium]|nr:type II toxin-antitoxin system RelE/ParE family toxin [bacterium]
MGSSDAASYRIRIKRSATKELRALPAPARRTLVGRIMKLARDPRPRGVEKLKGLENAYRIRSGVYRIVYEILDRELVVTVIRVAHRKDAYRR